jgi:soluble lytic murein transglycosylase-like protein
MDRPGLLIFVALLPAIALAAVKDPPVDDDHWSSAYDDHFRKYAKHYFGPTFDWRWFKAQGIAESNLKPRAKSGVGAKGIMQIMPATFREIQKKNPHYKDISTPRWNIAAGIYYDRQMYKLWKKENENIPARERLAFALGSYNAGFGGVRKAYRQASTGEKEVKRWEEVSPYTPLETRNYVKRIHGLMQAASAPTPATESKPTDENPQQQQSKPFFYRFFR